MGQWNHFYDGTYSHTVKCPHCGKEYSQMVEEQVPGFRDWEYDRCPYCRAENGASMSDSYTNSKIEE